MADIIIISEGKTKRIEQLADPNLVRIRTKDSLTANDAAIKADLPIAKDKTTQTVNIFYFLKKQGIPVAYVTRNDETSFVAKKCKMIPLECVIRRQPYGSYIKRHPEKTFADLFPLPVLEFFHKFTVVPPCTAHKNQHAINTETRLMPENRAREYYMEDGEWKHEVFCDPLVEPHPESATWLLYPAKQPRHEMQPLMDIFPVVTEDELSDIKVIMNDAFLALETAWKKHDDISLIDCKLEFGKTTESNELVIADVIDNDSWRIWPKGNPRKQLDKQSFRDGENLTKVQKKYRIVTEYTRQFG